MRGADQLLGIGSLLPFESRTKRVRSAVEHAAGGRNRSFAVLETALPLRTAFTLKCHFDSLSILTTYCRCSLRLNASVSRARHAAREPKRGTTDRSTRSGRSLVPQAGYSRAAYVSCRRRS